MLLANAPGRNRSVGRHQPRQHRQHDERRQQEAQPDEHVLPADAADERVQRLLVGEHRRRDDAEADREFAVPRRRQRTEQARRALDNLYGILQQGADIGQSDVDGAVRMAIAADDQLTLPTLERKGKMAAAQIATRKRTIYARSLNQDAYMRALERAELVFGIGPAGTGKTYIAVAHAAMLLERGILVSYEGAAQDVFLIER